MTNDDPGITTLLWWPMAMGTLLVGIPSSSLPTYGLRVSSCEREWREKEKINH